MRQFDRISLRFGKRKKVTRVKRRKLAARGPGRHKVNRR